MRRHCRHLIVHTHSGNIIGGFVALEGKRDTAGMIGKLFGAAVLESHNAIAVEA